MPVISCKKCGAKVSDDYSYCTNCQAPIKPSVTPMPKPGAKSHSNAEEWLLTPFESKGQAKRKVSSRTRQGGLVGAFVGLIHGIVGAIYVYFVGLPIVMLVLNSLVMESPGMARFLPTLWSILMVVMIVVVPIVGVIEGGVFGILFVTLMKRIPGSSLIRKSLAFSFILVAISLLSTILSASRSYSDPRLTKLFSSLDKSTLDAMRSMQVASFALTLIEYPLLGYLFGYLLDRRLRSR